MRRIISLGNSRNGRIPDVGVVECQECNRVGIPDFHSTQCNPGHQPQWRALAGSSLFPVETSLENLTGKNGGPPPAGGPSGRVYDPRTPIIKTLNRFIVLARVVALFVDPLFVFSVTATPADKPCIYIDGTMLIIATVLRVCVDAVHVVHIWLKFRMAYVSKETLVVGNGQLVWDPRAIVRQYVGSVKGFWLDLYVILPIPQVVYWFLLPKLLREEKVEQAIIIAQIVFLLQFIPKQYHSFYTMRAVRKVTGYLFGTVSWGFILNLLAYFLASHVSGGLWYILSMQRVAQCLKTQCLNNKQCGTPALTCPTVICYSSYTNPCVDNSTMNAYLQFCMDTNDDDDIYPYGLYAFVVPLILKNSNFVKVAYAILWGLEGISTMGNNLTPTSETVEVIFTLLMVAEGLALFTFLIGNIQVFLHTVTARRRKVQFKYRDMEWWMRRRQLPSALRRRVRHYEHQRWTAMGGQDEMELIRDLPDGLRRDIKRYLCLDLVKKVPLFHNLDDLILDHICDRVRPMIYTKDERILKEGGPVQRMVFIVSGRIARTQNVTQGMVTTSLMESGGFLGDELIAWSLRRPSIDRFPVSSATFTSVEPVEAYGLEAEDLLYITDHFRYTFLKGELKNKTRYYSSNWRSWAAVNIQFAWRRYLRRTRGDYEIRGTGGRDGGSSSDRILRHYAAMFMSLRPHDHLE